MSEDIFKRGKEFLEDLFRDYRLKIRLIRNHSMFLIKYLDVEAQYGKSYLYDELSENLRAIFLSMDHYLKNEQYSETFIPSIGIESIGYRINHILRSLIEIREEISFPSIEYTTKILSPDDYGNTRFNTTNYYADLYKPFIESFCDYMEDYIDYLYNYLFNKGIDLTIKKS